jgi:lysophospholipase L1-like esterase
VLFGMPVHVAVVIAGVNDSQGYIGADHYAHHVVLTAEALRQRGIFPMVVELPEYGIEHATSSDPLGQVRRRLMRRIYHDDRVDVIPMYRAALAQALAPRLDRGQVDLIDFDPVTADFHRSRDLFLPDAIHLSEKGRRALARQIGVALDARLRRLAERRPDQAGSASGSSRPPA